MSSENSVGKYIYEERGVINTINGDTRKRKNWCFVKLRILLDWARTNGVEIDGDLQPRRPKLAEKIFSRDRFDYRAMEEAKQHRRFDLARKYFKLPEAIVREKQDRSGEVTLAYWRGTGAEPTTEPQWMST